MQVDSNVLQMIAELSDAPGASGFEDEVVAVARRWCASIGELKEDFLRNLYIYRKENKGGRPVVMLDAHSDEVGLVIHSIKPNGTLRFLMLGSWNKNALIGTRVRVRNADGDYIPGIIAAKPVHFMSAAEKETAMNDIANMVIDVGATSYEDAVENFHVRMGEPVVPDTKFYYDEKRDLMFAKGFDCRIGCAALIEALRRLDGKELPCDVIAVLSTQEEMGPRNSKVTVHHIHPGIASVTVSGMTGVQIAGLLSQAASSQHAENRGLQIACYNGAVSMCGVQIGLINFACPAKDGWVVQIGLINGISHDEDATYFSGMRYMPIVNVGW